MMYCELMILILLVKVFLQYAALLRRIRRIKPRCDFFLSHKFYNNTFYLLFLLVVGWQFLRYKNLANLKEPLIHLREYRGDNLHKLKYIFLVLLIVLLKI